MDDSEYRVARWEAIQARREREDAGRARMLGCAQCGALDGMQAVWHGEAVWPDETYYRRANGATPHYRYVTCPECNRRGRVPPGYEVVSWEAVVAWAQAPCRCADCRRERGEVGDAG